MTLEVSFWSPFRPVHGPFNPGHEEQSASRSRFVDAAKPISGRVSVVSQSIPALSLLRRKVFEAVGPQIYDNRICFLPGVGQVRVIRALQRRASIKLPDYDIHIQIRNRFNKNVWRITAQFVCSHRSARHCDRKKPFAPRHAISLR